ncbi:hypothetical protein O181_025199 [Austropuccinia psidii MF-1]|uniref:Retrotransposon gag domain-containing protein n=1 Tax=Austropuccinia psidii MF-1 TaxID=1389203 RepID=A0A9Q3H0E4_9BASI|nr:hypothetical protein [Austropuccinia psidii MF-1]
MLFSPQLQELLLTVPQRTTFKGPGEDGEEEEENSVEEEESDGTEESEPSLLAIMQQMSQIMANLKEASSSESSRPPAFKTPFMKEPECFHGTQPLNVRRFIQYCQLIFHNYLANFSQDRKKVLYETSFLIGRAATWIEPYLFNLTNQDPSYLLNSWHLFESQLFTLFGDPNEVKQSEAEYDALRMIEGGHVSLYIANFRILVSRIGDWGERAQIHRFRKGLLSRILDQLASHPSRIDSLQDLMDITLELYTRYHKRQKEKKPEASKSNSSQPQSSSNSNYKKKNFEKRDMPHSSLLNEDFKLMNSEKERRIKEGLCTYGGGNHSIESCFKRPQNKLTQMAGKFPSQGKALVKIMLCSMVFTVFHPEHNCTF